jgi:hypothetical protein
LVPIEEIQDDAGLYYRVHITLTDRGRIRPNCFRDPKGDGMSTDWSKYATPAQTRLAKGAEKAMSYGVTELPVVRVRRIEQLTVIHAPVDGNDAHSSVHGLSVERELLTMQRHELYEACSRSWLIEPNSPIGD